MICGCIICFSQRADAWGSDDLQKVASSLEKIATAVTTIAAKGVPCK